MEEFKIYIVIDAIEFKKYCEKNLKSNENTEKLSLFNSFEDKEIHLVPHFMPPIFEYIVGIRQRYDIFVKTNNEWSKTNIISIYNNDIKHLEENFIILDYEVYKQWKDVEIYVINDREKIIEVLADKLSDEQKIVILNKCLKAGEEKIYIVKRDGIYNLLSKSERSKFAHLFNKTTINNADISLLLEQKIIESIQGKIEEKSNHIWIKDTKSLAVVTNRPPFRSPQIRISNNRFIAQTSFQSDQRIKRILAYGKTKQEALEKLRIKMQNELLKGKEIQSQKLENSIEDDFADI